MCIIARLPYQSRVLRKPVGAGGPNMLAEKAYMPQLGHAYAV